MTEHLAEVEPGIIDYYERADEDGRLRGPGGNLEYLRTQDVVRRLLPGGPAAVLDVGGGSGIHAEWLARDGHLVTLVDPVPLHVRQAEAIPGVTALVGHAEQLEFQNASFDAVLMLGPLYHLVERSARLRALREARRVLRAGGIVVAATINRHAPLFDKLSSGDYFSKVQRDQVDAALADGRNRFIGEFTTAYHHSPAEVVSEFSDAGLVASGQFGIEGMVPWMPGVGRWLRDAEQRDIVLDSLRLTESVPDLLGVSAHLLTYGRVQE